MNTKRTKKKNFSISELLLLAMASVILAAGGIMQVYASNKQIDTARKIDAAKKEIDEYYAEVNMTNVKIDRNLDRYLMKEDLLASGSTLRETDPNQLEVVKPGKAEEEEIAAISETKRLAP
jgi:flagellar basal body-associated protein FliL